MNDTQMIRIRADLKKKLKERADKEGRTLEWMLNDAVNIYLLSVHTTFPQPHVATIHTLRVDPTRPILDQQNDPTSDLYAADIKPDITHIKGNDAMQQFLKQNQAKDKRPNTVINPVEGEGVTYEPFE